MNKTIFTIVRKKGMLICFFFLIIFAIDTYAQYGTSRRVARRTARRTSSRHAAYNYGYGGGAGYVNTLPGGCILRAISGINYQYCGGIYYRPYYHGTELVYQEVDID